MDVSQGCDAGMRTTAELGNGVHPAGVLRNFWRVIASVFEDLTILTQFAFGKEYGAGSAAKPGGNFPARLAPSGNL